MGSGSVALFVLSAAFRTPVRPCAGQKRTPALTNAHTHIRNPGTANGGVHGADFVLRRAPPLGAYIRPFSMPFQYMRGRPYALSAYML